MTPSRYSLLAMLTVLSLVACDKTDQFDRPGTWKLPPAGQSSNDANLRAMIANPNDLIVGQDAPGSVAPEAIPPVNLLYAGRRRTLPATTTNGGSEGSTDQRPYGSNLGGGGVGGASTSSGGASGAGGGGGGGGGGTPGGGGQ